MMHWYVLHLLLDLTRKNIYAYHPVQGVPRDQGKYVHMSLAIIDAVKLYTQIHFAYDQIIRQTIFQFTSLPIPPQVSHVNSSKIKNGVVPRPPHRQHNRPPIRGSPGKTTVEPGGGAPVIGTGIGRETELRKG
jgi:hypothetical protein